MKIAVTSQEPHSDAAVDPRFGRARYFLVFDDQTDEVSVVDNSINLNAVQGAGVQASKKVIELGAQAVITGHVGPKAFATLRAGGVKVYTGATGTVTEAIEQFKADKLKSVQSADVDGHWI